MFHILPLYVLPGTSFSSLSSALGCWLILSWHLRAGGSAYDRGMKLVGAVEKDAEFSEVSAEAETYPEAKTKVEALVPEGWKLISLRRETA